MLVLADAAQMLVAEHDVVDALYLEREVIEAGFRSFEAEERVMVYIGRAAVAPVERRDDVALVANIDVVRADEPERLAVPLDLLRHALGHDHRMGDALDLGWAGLEPHQFAGTSPLLVAPVQHDAPRRQRRDLLHSADQLDLVAVWIAEAHAFAAARLVVRLDARGPRRLCRALQIVLALDEEAKSDEFGRPQMRHMNM